MNQKITVCAFLHQGGKLFIAKRADTKKFLPGKYELPGGHIEFGETLIEGLRREFREEFGVEVEIGDVIYAFTYMNGQDQVVEIDFLAELQEPKAPITLHPEDHSEYKWVNQHEVEKIWDQADAEYPAIIKGFEMLRREHS